MDRRTADGDGASFGGGVRATMGRGCKHERRENGGEKIQGANQKEKTTDPVMLPATDDNGGSGNDAAAIADDGLGLGLEAIKTKSHRRKEKKRSDPEIAQFRLTARSRRRASDGARFPRRGRL